MADPNLAIELRGVNKEKLGPFLNAIGSFTRFYSGLMTRFNPEFFAPNKIRDLQESMIYVASQKGMGAKGATGTALRDPQSVKAVLDGLRGKDTPGARAYADMKKHGGTTGGMGLSTRKQAEMDVEDMARTANSRPRTVAKTLIDGVDNLNTVFEDSTRLSVYRTALSQGLSKDQAAALAKEASINFNRMGKGGPVVNALYMFSNASIQGSAKMLRSMRNPKVAASVITAVGAAVAATSAYNDQIDPEWRDKVTKWDRLNALPIMVQDKDGAISYVTIPISWGLKPIKVFADYADDTLMGHDVDLRDAATHLFSSIAEGYNPVGGTDPVSAVTPTILDAPVEIARNKAWSGSKIRPDFDKNAPASIQYFDSLREKASGRVISDATGQLSRAGIEISPADINYAYEQYIGGVGRAVTKTANTLWGIKDAATGEGDVPPMSEWPLVSRFYKERTGEEVASSATEKGADLKALEGEASKERFYRAQKATEIMKELGDMGSNDERKARLKEIAAEDPELAKKVLEEIKDAAAGLTPLEKKLKNSTVNSRAEFIMQEVDGLDPAARKAKLKEYAEKRVLTDAVLKRIIELRKENAQP